MNVCSAGHGSKLDDGGILKPGAACACVQERTFLLPSDAAARAAERAAPQAQPYRNGLVMRFIAIQLYTTLVRYEYDSFWRDIFFVRMRAVFVYADVGNFRTLTYTRVCILFNR